MPQKLWIPGEEVVADDLNDYLQNQVVPQFADSGERDSEWPVPPTGAVCMVAGSFQTYLGAAWYTPFRRVDYVQRTTDTTNASAETIALTSNTVVLPANRLIRVAAGWRNGTGGAGEAVVVNLREGTTTAGTHLQDYAANIAPSGSQAGTCSGGRIDVCYTPSAGSKQWIFTVGSTTGTAVKLTANATAPLWLSVTDEGAA